MFELILEAIAGVVLLVYVYILVLFVDVIIR